MDNNSNDLFSDDEHFWTGNEEDESRKYKSINIFIVHQCSHCHLNFSVELDFVWNKTCF